MYEGLSFSTYLLTLTLACVSLYYSHPSVCEVTSHCGSNLYFAIMASDAKPFLAFTSHLYIFFREMFRSFAHFYLPYLPVTKY